MKLLGFHRVYLKKKKKQGRQLRKGLEDDMALLEIFLQLIGGSECSCLPAIWIAICYLPLER